MVYGFLVPKQIGQWEKMSIGNNKIFMEMFGKTNGSAEKAPVNSGK